MCVELWKLQSNGAIRISSEWQKYFCHSHHINIILYDTGIFSYRQALLFFFERYGKVVNVRTKEKRSVSEYITI